ncbi:MAG: hypothetical protein AB1468_03310 [Candidatus Micrarchaeota archaeon]
MRGRYGQAAMEYLMTYGWAILIIVVVLAALFIMGVFNPKPVSTCNFPTAGVFCTGHRVRADTVSGATLAITVANGAGKKIYITGLGCAANVTDNPNIADLREEPDNPYGIPLAPGDSVIIPQPSVVVYCYDIFENRVLSKAGESFNGKIFFRYNEDSPTGLEHTIIGDLSTRLEV